MDVSIRDLDLRYGDNTVVRGLNLDIADGETIVLLGRSGCGKTSTMRCIAGLETPSRGVITIGGRTVFDSGRDVDVRPNRRNVGMVFQSYAVWPHRTVIENVSFGPRVRRVPRAQAKAKAMEVLEIVGLAHLADRPATMLSGGQMQRVALARSIAASPDVLLLDEPLSNLDASLRDELRVELRRIQAEAGLTSVYVTHDQGEALALADRIAVMEDGVITQLDTPQQVYTRPASAAIARFLGAVNSFAVDAAGPGRFRAADSTFEVASDVVQPDGVTACFRPDAMSFRPLDPTTPSEVNTWDGTAVVAVYQGRAVRARIHLDAGVSVEAVVETDRLVKEGDRVRVHIDPTDVLILPEHSHSIDQGEVVSA